MSELKRRKFNKIMDHRDKLERDGASAISQLQAAVDQAVDFSILLEVDPSDQFSTNGDKEEVRGDFENSMASLMVILPKIELIRQLKDSEITIEEFKVATSKTAFDVVEYEKSISR